MIRRRVLWLIPGAFFALFFGYPVVTLLGTALGSDPLAAFTQLGSWSVGGVIAFTVGQAALSTVVTMVVGLPGAAILGRYRFRGRSLLEALSVVVFVLPSVVIATAVTALLPNGADRGLAPIVLAHLMFNLAVVWRLAGSYWSRLDPRPAEAAACLGASPWRVLWFVTLPRLRPALAGAAALIFLFTFTSFGIVLLLGGPGQATLEVEIQRQALFLFNLPLAAALSVVQIVVVIALLLVQRGLDRRLVAAEDSPATRRRPRTTRERWLVTLVAVGSTALLATPILVVALAALRVGDRWSVANFTGLGSVRADSVLFVSPLTAIGNSLLAAGAATVIAVLIGSLVAWLVVGRATHARGLASLWLLPLGVSAVTLGFGILIAFDSPPIAWRTSWWMVPVAQALIAIPFVVRAVLPALESINPRVRQAAALLGAAPRQVLWHVEVPLVARSLAVAAGFAFAISLGEFGATVFVARADRPTVPIAIYRFLGMPGDQNQGAAMALAVILIGLTGAVVFLTERWRTPGTSHV